MKTISQQRHSVPSSSGSHTNPVAVRFPARADLSLRSPRRGGKVCNSQWNKLQPIKAHVSPTAWFVRGKKSRWRTARNSPSGGGRDVDWDWRRRHFGMIAATGFGLPPGRSRAARNGEIHPAIRKAARSEARVQVREFNAVPRGRLRSVESIFRAPARSGGGTGCPHVAGHLETPHGRGAARERFFLRTDGAHRQDLLQDLAGG